MAEEQKGLFTPIEPERNGNGRKLQRLFVPKLLREAADSKLLRGDEFQQAHQILCKWADLESDGKIQKRNERQLTAEFLTEVFGKALGYSVFSAGLENWNLEPAFAVPQGEADAAIGFFSSSEPKVPRVLVELKGPKVNVDRDRSNGRTPVRQLFDYLIEVPACPWGIVCNCVSFRLYHREKTTRVYEQFTLQELRDEKKFREFYCLFERGAFLPVLAGQKPRCDSLLEQSAQAQREVGGKLYALYHDQRIALIRHLRRPPHDLEINDAIHAAQKLLDRIIFIAFCEDRRLLPPKSIDRTWNSIRAFELDENPRWRSFLQLFKSVDRGNRRELVNAFNGELFKENLVDRLELNDDWTDFFREIADYDFADEVNVDVLGRLFEQSITDLEEFRKSPDEPAVPPAQSKPGRRKREGVYYTPPHITKFIVKHTLGPCLADYYAALAKTLGLDQATPPAERSGKAWAKFHHGQLEVLKRFRVCDPACGSGAFLIEAFEFLEDEYEKVIEDLIALGELKESALDSVSATILHGNLFGVDLSPEAVEITKLALWIRTAEINKPLSNLSGNIRCGNSVVDDSTADERAFDWAAQFPQVFAEGKFDCVIGNPPYVRQELLTKFKSHWETRFSNCFSSTADIYVYFYALGFDLLRSGGRLGFISSSAFARSAYAESLRRFLVEQTALEQFIDLGDTQVFADAKDVYPAIVILRNPPADRKTVRTSVRSLRLRRRDDVTKIDDEVRSRGRDIQLERFGPGGWELGDEDVAELRMKLSQFGKPLGEWIGDRFFRGIITGLNEAFVISTDQMAGLGLAAKISKKMLKPFVGGQHLRRWYAEPSGEYLILIPNGWTRRESGCENERAAWKWLRAEYPTIANHLEPFADKARQRLDQGEYWWELRPCDYYEAFDQPKIMYPDIAKTNRFHLDDGAHYSSNTTYFLPVDDGYLLGILNSKATWFSLGGISIPFGERAGEFRYRLFSQYVGKLPIPAVKKRDAAAIESLAKQCNSTAPKLYELQSRVRHRLESVFGLSELGMMLGNLNNKANDWWKLSFHDLGAELKKSFKLPANPLKSPKTADKWESYLTENRREVERLSRELADAEAEINDRVYRLFQLTPDEIKLLAREVEH